MKWQRKRTVAIGLMVGGPPLLLCIGFWIHEFLDDALQLPEPYHAAFEFLVCVSTFVLAIAAFVRLVKLKQKPIPAFLGTIILFFVLSLLFPVMTARDDGTETLIDDAATSHAVTKNVRRDSHKADAESAVFASSVISVPQWRDPILSRVEDSCEDIPLKTLETPRHATGNHSPPLG